MQIFRPVVFQPLTSLLVVVGVTPTQLIPTYTKADLIDSFVLSVDALAANNVFIGDQGVTTGTGIEVVAGGGPVNFRIRNQWQHYELQDPLLQVAEGLECQPISPFSVPFIVWDLSQIYAVAVAPTNMRIMPFRSQFT